MSVPDHARQIAAQLAEALQADQKLAEQQSCQHRLQGANNALWSGLHPDAVGLLYDDTHEVGIGEQATIRSRITAATADARAAGASDEEGRDRRVAGGPGGPLDDPPRLL